MLQETGRSQSFIELFSHIRLTTKDNTPSGEMKVDGVYINTNVTMIIKKEIIIENI